MYCGNCGAEHSADVEVCPKCGASYGILYCKFCGARLPFRAEVCLNCKHDVKEDPRKEKVVYSEQKHRSVLLLLMWLLGGSGIPSIYLGYTIPGVLLLFFHVALFAVSCVFPLMWIAAIADYIIASAMGRLMIALVVSGRLDKDAKGIPLKTPDDAD